MLVENTLGLTLSRMTLITSTLMSAPIGAGITSDIFCLLGYNSGYALFPVLAFDQLSQAQSRQGKSQPIQSIYNSCMLLGILGAFYGILMLKVAKLGFRNSEMRSMPKRVGMFTAVNLLPILGTQQLFKVIKKDKEGRPELRFDPIRSYVNLI